MYLSPRNLLLFAIIIWFGTHLQAQNSPVLSISQDIKVFENGVSLKSPFAGGLNLPQISKVDIDLDGLLDIVAFDRSGNRLLVFRNTGVAGNPDYRHAPELEAGFPKSLINFCLMRDYNCDGKADIFTWQYAGLQVYKNTSTPGQVSFILADSLITTDNGNGAGPVPLYVAFDDIPAIEDIDGDGDMDFLTFDGGGSYVEFHRNTSVELLGTCEGTDYVLEDGCWGKFFESGLSNQLTLNVTCKGGPGSQNTQGTAHSGSTVAVFDASGNGAIDIFLGDLLFPSILMGHNNGTSVNGHLDTAYYNYPAYNTPVDLYVFPAVFFLDVDEDGRTDMVCAPNANNISVNYEGIWYYRNTGTGPAANFELTDKLFLQEDMVDQGFGSMPVFFDHNGDGLMDIVIGNYTFKTTSSSTTSSLSLYENTGTATAPEYTLITRDYANISSAFFPPLTGLSPAFGDLDNDGDLDMILGDSDGRIHLLLNSGGAGNPAVFSLTTANYMGIDVGQSAVPTIADLNRDGKLDLVIGEEGGTLNYFENIGTVSVADFTSSPTDAAFGNVDTDINCCSGNSAPFIYENPVTNRWDMVVGAKSGRIYYYADIESQLGGAFVATDSTFGDISEGNRSFITGADIDQDGEMEWAVGNIRGGLGIYEIPEIMSVRPSRAQVYEVDLFPNPGNGAGTIRISNGNFVEQLEVEVFDLTGKKLAGFQMQGNAQISIPQLGPAGIYMVKVSGEKGSTTLRWSVQP